MPQELTECRIEMESKQTKKTKSLQMADSRTMREASDCMRNNVCYDLTLYRG